MITATVRIQRIVCMRKEGEMWNCRFAAWSAASGLFLVVSGLSAAPGQPNRGQTRTSPSDSTFAVRPDLSIRGVTIMVASPVPSAGAVPSTQLKIGQKCTLVCYFRNLGGDLKGVWKLGYKIDGQMVWNQSWGDVPAGAWQTKSYSGYVPSVVGEHTYECSLDFDKQVNEQEEGNNRTGMRFTVVP